MTDGFAMELCGTQGSYQIVPDDVSSVDLETVGAAIEAAGFEVGVLEVVLDLLRSMRDDALPQREAHGSHRGQGLGR